jgi:hypothetical protein
MNIPTKCDSNWPKTKNLWVMVFNATFNNSGLLLLQTFLPLFPQKVHAITRHSRNVSLGALNVFFQWRKPYSAVISHRINYTFIYIYILI